MSSKVDVAAINAETATTVAEQAEAAGRTQVDPNDLITQLEDHAKRVIDQLAMPSHHRMMALPKLQELVFWLRAGAGRG
jgi:hypothetical protein